MADWTKSPHAKEIRAVLDDADNSEVSRDGVLRDMSRLNHQLNGDARHWLTDEVYRKLDQRK